jgi:hypothetical protein
MAQNIRQAKLFAAEDYTVVYESYVNGNFQAYDYDTIRTAMVDYVRNTYPENFNDWIESSEFVAILDLVAQFGHNLAYRVDLNSRNNFLSTATRQESVFKLAEFLGYQPRRNVPAFGEMKLVAVKTNEAVIGSQGTSLGGKEIRFESTNNVNNLDDFITVVNAVMQIGNQFGSPKKQLVLDGVQTQFYDLNNTANQIKFDVTGFAFGSSVTYNIINSDYSAVIDSVTEKDPDPDSAFGIYYKNDGKGLSSANTGFFFGVKQGSLQFKDYSIETPIDNLMLDVDVENINQTDVWVQSIDADGNVLKNWTKVRDVTGNNIAYNDINSGIRDIFAVKTRTNNQISVQFADRSFGNLPKNTIRIWYRTSVNATYVVRPDDLANKKITVGYQGQDGNVYSAVFTVQLKTSIINASASESLDSIKENAPKVYAAQDRMITASDYNTIIQSQTGGILKIKSINRTFSGHSRYIDFMDPTGTYSSLDIFGKDGILYKHDDLISSSTDSGDSAQRIFENYLKPALDNDELVSLYYSKFKISFEELKTLAGYTPTLATSPLINFGDNGFKWNSPSQIASGANTGYITFYNNTAVSRVGDSQTNYLKYFSVGALVKFKLADGTSKWASVVNVFADGLGVEFTGVQSGQPSGLNSNGLGAITLDTIIPSGSVIDIIYPTFSRVFTAREQEIIIKYLDAKKTFSLNYDYVNSSWELNSTPPLLDVSGSFPTDFTNAASSWIIYMKYESGVYNMYLRTVRYYMRSDKTQFSNISNELTLDTYTKKAFRDSVSFTGVSGSDIAELGNFYIYGYETNNNGYSDPNIVILSTVDANNNSRPDNPDVFNDIVESNYVNVDISGVSTTVPGKDNLRFEWNHIAADNEVVDPSFTNIIDVYVLSKLYDTDYRNWLTTNKGSEPVAPTTYQLSKQFASVNSKKSISDSIIYKPVKYKPLFGPKADAALRAKFSVIKLQGSTATDNEVKSKVITAVNDFFAVSNWDFGETFYFTELAAYVHKTLAGLISSFVIVPQGAGSVFGDLFQITPNSDEMFIPDVSLTDVTIVLNITENNIKAGQ